MSTRSIKSLFLPFVGSNCYLTILAILLSACGEMPYTVSPADGLIIKGRAITGAVGEVAPIAFQGHQYLISFADITKPGDGFIQVQSYPDMAVVSRYPFPYNYGSAIVENGRVHVFASSITTQGPGNRIVTAYSDDLTHWSSPTQVLQAPVNQTVYNSTVTKTAAGFVLAYEIHEEGHPVWWQNQFMGSTDLVRWSPTGGAYAPTGGAACPTIRYYDGYYYLFTLRDRFQNVRGSQYFTTVARSRDLVTWEESGREVLTSAGRIDEGTNNSDIEFFEYDGKLIVIYMVGDQVTFGFMKEGHFKGSLAEFLTVWFNGSNSSPN